MSYHSLRGPMLVALPRYRFVGCVWISLPAAIKIFCEFISGMNIPILKLLSEDSAPSVRVLSVFKGRYRFVGYLNTNGTDKEYQHAPMMGNFGWSPWSSTGKRTLPISKVNNPDSGGEFTLVFLHHFAAEWQSRTENWCKSRTRASKICACEMEDSEGKLSRMQRPIHRWRGYCLGHTSAMLIHPNASCLRSLVILRGRLHKPVRLLHLGFRRSSFRERNGEIGGPQPNRKRGDSPSCRANPRFYKFIILGMEVLSNIYMPHKNATSLDGDWMVASIYRFWDINNSA